MEAEKKTQSLQALFVGMAADAVLRLGNEGVLEKVVRDKRQQKSQIGKANALLFGVKEPQQCFTNVREILNCADWEVEDKENGFISSVRTCKLCAMAKSIGAQSPCYIYCLDVQEAMIKSLDSSLEFQVKETLWDGEKCLVEITKGID